MLMWTPLNDLDKIPDIVDTKTKWLAVLSKFHPPSFLFVWSFSFYDKKWTDKNNAPEHLCFMCPMSLM